MSGQTHYRPRYPHTIAEDERIEDYIRTHPGCSSADVAMYLGRPGQAGGVRVRRSGPWLRRLDIWAKENGGPTDPPRAPGTPEPVATPDRDLAERDLESHIVEVLRKGPRALNDLAVIVKATRGHVLDIIDSLLRHGVNVRQAGDQFALEGLPDVGTNTREPVVFLSTTDSTFKFGVIADTHVGSKYARPDVVAALYRAFAAEGVKAVFHAGNMIEGESTFNRYDLDVYGMDRQIEALVKGWPKYPGITTYAVHGDDHEGWYGKTLGLDMGKAIETAFRDAGRDDWVDLGFLEADVLLKNAITGAVASVRVTHPGGGSAYSTSYAPQKLIESFSGGEKPGALVIGHYHKMGVFHYRNVWAILAGTTKDQDVFMRKKRLAAHVGGVIVDFTQDPATGALVGCRVDMRQFFDAGYYNERNGRWSQAAGVVHPTMSAVPTDKPKTTPKPTKAKRHKPRIPPV